MSGFNEMRMGCTSRWCTRAEPDVGGGVELKELNEIREILVNERF